LVNLQEPKFCVQHAFFEDKKVEETSPRKSTPRTLKKDDQQYPGVNRAPKQQYGSGHATQEQRLYAVACRPWLGGHPSARYRMSFGRTDKHLKALWHFQPAHETSLCQMDHGHMI
jgi:hypothetical protein